MLRRSHVNIVGDIIFFEQGGSGGLKPDEVQFALVSVDCKKPLTLSREVNGQVFSKEDWTGISERFSHVAVKL